MNIKNKQSLQKLWIDTNYNLHMHKLLSMKSTIVTHHRHRFSHSKSKRDQITEDRFTEIEKSNRILLEKMSNIYSKQATRMQIQLKRELYSKVKKGEYDKIRHENNVL